MTKRLNDDSRKGIEEAVAEVMGQPGEQQNAETPAGTQPPTPETPKGEAPEAGPASTESAAPEAPEGTGEERTSYAGLDLSKYTPEERAQIIKFAQEQNKAVNKAFMERADFQKRAEALEKEAQDLRAQLGQPQSNTGQQPPQEAQPASDEELAKSLGLDLEDPIHQDMAKFLLPLARQNQQLSGQLQQVQQAQTEQQMLDFYETTLAGLEKQHGELPIPREEVYEKMLEWEDYNPESVFWRVMGPAYRSASTEAARIRAEAEEQRRTGKVAASTARPTAGAQVAPEPPKGKVRQAMQEASKQAEDELGFSWESALQSSPLGRG